MENFKFYGSTKIITSGKGELFFEDGTKKEGEFEVALRDDATLLFSTQTSSPDMDMIDALSSTEDRIEINKIVGMDDNSRKVSVTDLFTKNITSHADITKGSEKIITGYAGSCEIGTKVLKGGYKIRFDLLNFLFYGNASLTKLELSLSEIDITIMQIEDYGIVKKVLKHQGGVHPTSVIEIEVRNRHTFDEIHKCVHKLCRLLSIARSTWITWASVEILDANNKRVYELYRNAIIRDYHGNGLIDETPEWTVKFLESAWLAYDENYDVFDLARFIAGYIDTFSNTFIEARGLNIAVLVEYLSSRWATHENKTTFLKSEDFTKKLERLQNGISSLLDDVFTDLKPAYKNAMLLKINDFNSRPFKWKLSRLRNSFDIPIIDDEIRYFISLRDKLAHTASFPKETKGAQLYLFMRHFLDRIVLKLFNYNGQYFDIEHRKETQIG